MISATHYITLCVILFVLGALGAIIRRNAIIVLMCIALMFCAAVLTFAIGARLHASVVGQVWGTLVLVAFSAELCVGVALLLALFRRRKSLDLDRWERLRW